MACPGRLTFTKAGAAFPQLAQLQGKRARRKNFIDKIILQANMEITTTYEGLEEAMATRIIDISVALQNDIASDPPGNEPKITYIAHKQSAPEVCAFFPGLTPDQLPDGEGWAVERVEISTHNGTHLDAPWHFASTMDGGKRAITIDEVPLEWCFQPGVKLDFRRFPNGYVATAADVEAELKRIGHTLKPLEIVVVNTIGRRALRPTGLCADWVRHGPGGDALSHLARREDHRHRRLVMGCAVRLHGQEICRDQECQADLGGPQVGPRDRLLPHREACTTSRRCQPTGFKVACFPVKIKGASAGWTRAVAILEE